MEDREGTKEAKRPDQDILSVPFDRRLLLSFVQDITELAFRYRSDEISCEDFVIAVRDRLDAMGDVANDRLLRWHLGQAQSLMDCALLHQAADRLGDLVAALQAPQPPTDDGTAARLDADALFGTLGEPRGAGAPSDDNGEGDGCSC